jgi:hypothetical protein
MPVYPTPCRLPITNIEEPILVVALCTLLCGGESFDDMADFGRAKQEWFKTFLPLRNGIPSHDTFNRVFAALDSQKFLECFLRWTQSLRQAVAQEIVALDGKALRRALHAQGRVKYIVSAWAESNRLALGQLKVADKSNAITALPEWLRVLELAGCIVTVDGDGLPEKDRPRNPGSRRRLRTGPQGQSRNRA